MAQQFYLTIRRTVEKRSIPCDSRSIATLAVHSCGEGYRPERQPFLSCASNQAKRSRASYCYENLNHSPTVIEITLWVGTVCMEASTAGVSLRRSPIAADGVLMEA